MTLGDTCGKCGNQGFYFDQRCLDNECAHRGSERLVEKDGKKCKKLVRIMPCPPRPCSCPHGKPARAELQAKIRLQQEAFSRTEP